ncbi:hypothetical protein [Martelella limonii]|uniref:hypothetical protein n=1 Tax=Martelella limonii TaxID=1647649 RepID=UPI001580F45C|nr:hypothetical protein [Martelella limonii]
MNIAIAATYAALVFLLFSLPSGRMMAFAGRRYQRGIETLPLLGLGILAARFLFFALGLAIAMGLALAMPSGLTLARIAAAFIIALWIGRSLAGLKRPAPAAANDNAPRNQALKQIWLGMRHDARPYAETLLAASTLIFFVDPQSVSLQMAETLSVAHIAASIAALVLYGLLAGPVLARINAQRDRKRQQRIARLLRSGLPRVSARYRKNAA